jgi:hypothetical protein
LLVDPLDPQQAANAMIKAITDENLRLNVLKKNYAMIRSRAEISGVRKEFSGFILSIDKSS